jgi:hypothetical protein
MRGTMTKTDPIIICLDDTGAEGEYTSLDRKVWRELRKVQGIDKGKPLMIQENGRLQLGREFSGYEVRVFVKRLSGGITS